MRGRAVWTLVSGVSVLLVSSLAQAQCTKDTDCKGERVCEAGKCTSPASAPAPAPSAQEASDTAPPAADTTAPTDGQASVEPSEAPVAAEAVKLQSQPAAPRAEPGASLPPEPDQPKTHRRSRGAMIAGIAMVSVGPIALLAALAAKNAQSRCDDALQRDYPDHRLPSSERYRVEDCNAYSVPLYVFGIGGALLGVGGIPLIVYGAKSVRDEAPRVTLQVLPWAGPHSSGLRFRLDL